MSAPDTFTTTVDGAAAHALGFDAGEPDPRPTGADLARDEAAPPVPQARRLGRPVVARYVSPPEALVHLGFDGATTMCGQPWEFRVLTSGHPTCPACVEAAGGSS